jgi:hypothetical protein
MTTENNCPSCRRPLASDAPRGLCPECLMKAGFGTGKSPDPGGSADGSTFTPPPVAEVAKHFPQLEVLEFLGRGGMGVVYRARQPQLNRLVALKILAPEKDLDSAFAERFTREAPELQGRVHCGPSGRYQFGLLPNLLSGERVLHFQKRVGVTLWKSLPTYRFNVSWPPLSEMGLYVTDRRVIVVSHVFRLVTHEFSLWFPGTAPGAAYELLKRVTIGQSRWFGPYLDLISEHPEKRWYRSRELRLRLYLRQPEMLAGVVVTASSGAQDAWDQPAVAAREERATPGMPPRPIRWARWTARIFAMLILLTIVPFVLTEGLPPFARQPGGVQFTSVGGFLIVLGLIIGWWREGTAAVLIAAGWTLVRASECEFRMTTPFEMILVVALLYAAVWWALQGRKTGVAMTVAATLVVVLILGRLLLPTNVHIEGRVTDAVTGKPIPGAELTVLKKLPSAEGQVAVPNARTSADGRFSLYVGWYTEQKLLWVSAPAYNTLGTNLGIRVLGQRHVNRQFVLYPIGQAFGPVIERVLSGEDRGANTFIDLDQDKIWSTPPEIVALPDADAELLKWAKTNGVDALAVNDAKDRTFCGLVVLDAVVEPTANDALDTLTSVQAVGAMASEAIAAGAWQYLSAEGPLPKTWLVRTREGSTGVLQIVGLTEGPRGVRLRYKLARTNAAAILETTQPFDPSTVSNPTNLNLPQQSPWADPNLSVGLATLVWRVLAEPLVSHGPRQRYMWLSTTARLPACMVRGPSHPTPQKSKVIVRFLLGHTIH